MGPPRRRVTTVRWRATRPRCVISELEATFTENSVATLKLPIISPRQDAYIFASEGTDLFSVTRLIDGRGGNVNRVIEKSLLCAATTRNWNTIERIVKLHE